MKNKNIIFIVAVLVVAAIGLYAYLRAPSGIIISTDEQLKVLNSPAPSGSFSLPQVKWLANGKPDLSGPIEYKVSFGGSADGPTISKIVFAPYDVKSGDAQDVYVVGGYEGGISGVTAAVKTDKGIMPLQLALAQGDAKNGVWKGNWTVKDVHPGYYTVDFTATSADGKSRGTSAAFLDGLLSDIFATPVYADYGLNSGCNEGAGFSATGTVTLSGSCILNGSDAVVSGNLIISNLGSLVIPATFTFGFSNGYYISFCPGGTCSISIATGGQVVKTGVGSTPYNVYVEDRDGDNYWDMQDVKTSNPYGAGGKLRSAAAGGGDCNDINGNIYQTVANLVTDADQDGYAVGSAASQCAGGTTSVGGRTYYKSSSAAYTWLGSSSSLGTDCNDASSAYWQNLTGYPDQDSDTYGAGSGAWICSGASLPSGYVNRGGDCYDTLAGTNMTCDGTTKNKARCVYPGQDEYFITSYGDSPTSMINPASVTYVGYYSDGTRAYCGAGGIVCGLNGPNGGSDWNNQRLACCTLTAEGQTYLPASYSDANTYEIDGDQGSALYCNAGGILVGAQWAKDGQIDRGRCTNALKSFSGGSSRWVYRNSFCLANELVNGAWDYTDPDKNDAWEQVLCTPLISSSWDYNCSGYNDGQYSGSYGCQFIFPSTCNIMSVGWSSGAPSCGQTGDWANGCSYNGSYGCSPGDSPRQQGCR